MKPIYVCANMSERQKKAYVSYELKTRAARERAFIDMIKHVAYNALGEKADLELVYSMVTRRYKQEEERAFTEILKRRARLAQERGLDISVFRGVPFDCALADEIALLNSYHSKGESDAGKDGRRGTKHRPRAKGVTDEWIAGQFHALAVPLIRGRDEDGKPIYERQRGGNHSGKCVKGACTVSTVRKWIKQYPDEHNAEPKSGFHAEMLTDKKAIEAAAKCWGDYWQDYAKQFYEWRQVHKGAPRSQFRYHPVQIVHGAEKIADRRRGDGTERPPDGDGVTVSQA